MILLTGATGIIGREVIRHISGNNIGLVRAMIRADEDRDVFGDTTNVEFVKGDILDVSSLERAIDGVDYVIHAAGLVSFSPAKRALLYQINTKGTSNLLNLSLEAGVSKFVHISSIAALGKPKDGHVINENSTWEDSGINSHYGKSKYQAELEVWRAIQEGLNAIIINPSVLLGPGSWDRSSTRLFKYIFDGNVFTSMKKTDFVDVRDVVSIIFKLMNSNVCNDRFIVSNTSCQYDDLFKIIAQAFNKRAPSVEVNPIIGKFLWRIEHVRSLFTGKEPLVTRETTQIASHNFSYDNRKINEIIDHQYYSLEESVNWIVKNLLKENDKQVINFEKSKF